LNDSIMTLRALFSAKNRNEIGDPISGPSHITHTSRPAITGLENLH
jgi:hypothetical protein